MKRLKVAGLVLAALLMLTLPASAAGRFGRGFYVRPAIGFWGGWYDPFFYDWYGPYWSYPAYAVNEGQLKVKTNVKNADVFINGAFAGKAGKLKSMWLRPDAYNIEVRAPGYTKYAERVYVVPGKTIKVDAELAPTTKP